MYFCGRCKAEAAILKRNSSLLPVQLIIFKVSTRFAKNLLSVFQSEHPTQFGSTASVVSAFTEVSRFSLSFESILGQFISFTV